MLHLIVEFLLDPYLASFYPVYSLAANFTNPHCEDIPNSICFSVDTRYVPEGEEDLVRLEALKHQKRDVYFFIWKTFEKQNQSLFIRYKKVTWKLIVHQGGIFKFEFCTSNNILTCNEASLEKIVGWPDHKNEFETLLSVSHMEKVAKCKQLPKKNDW